MRLNLLIRPALARAYIRILGTNRVLTEVLLDSTLPVINLSAYVYTYHFLGASPEYVGFVILGGTMLAFWLNVLWNVGSQLYWEKEVGNLEALLIAPAPKMSLLTGMALGGMVNTTLRVLLTIAIGVTIFQVRFDIARWPEALLIFCLTIMDLYALGMVFSSLYLLFGREAWHISNLLQEPISFLSGLYYPIKFLPFWLQALASLIPMALGLDMMRKIFFFGSGLWADGFETFILTSMAPLLFLLAKFSLDYMENFSKREGRLTLKWQ